MLAIRLLSIRLSTLAIVAVLAGPGVIPAAAQHHGGHGMGGSLSGGPSRPTGIDEKDDLKDFHLALAVQATAEQIKEFTSLLKHSDAAEELLTRFADSKRPREGNSDADTALDQLCSESRKFQAGFSEVQKDGLKHQIRRVEKTVSQLEQEAHRLDQALIAESSGALSSELIAANRALKDFANEQFVLGREMGITLASDQDVTFSLPSVRNSVYIGNRPTAVTTSGVLSQTSTSADARTFQLSTTVDLSDLQQTFTEILSSQLSQSGSCEKRISLRHATILGAPPASSVLLQLHFERWSCGHAFGQSSPVEIAEGEATVEMTLTPLEKSNVLNLSSECKRVEAVGIMQDELRSGDLGSDLRDKVAAAVLTAANAGLNAKTTLPSSLQGASILRSGRFDELSGRGLSLIVEQEMQLSNAQVTSLASQLNQALSANRAAPQKPSAP